MKDNFDNFKWSLPFKIFQKGNDCEIKNKKLELKNKREKVKVVTLLHCSSSNENPNPNIQYLYYLLFVYFTKLSDKRKIMFTDNVYY